MGIIVGKKTFFNTSEKTNSKISVYKSCCLIKAEHRSLDIIKATCECNEHQPKVAQNILRFASVSSFPPKATKRPKIIKYYNRIRSVSMIAANS